MFRIIRFDLLLKYTALLTIAISIGIYSIVQSFFSNDPSLFKIITISSIVSSIIIFSLLSPGVSRNIWHIASIFDKSIFPDLNGTWEGEVTFENNNKIIIRAVIRQSLLTTQIDMHGETTKSITLETTPTIEQGQKKLYYVYRSYPKDPVMPAYTGSTLFDIRYPDSSDRKIIQLSGHYYTDRKSIGRIYLDRTGTDSDKDISFY
jgi:hypothetical protein